LDNTKAKAKQVTGKFRELVRKYGAVGVTTYFSIYGITLTSMFLLFDFNVLPSQFFGYSVQDAMMKVCYYCTKITDVVFAGLVCRIALTRSVFVVLVHIF